MEAVTGIFTSQVEAERAVQRLRAIGIEGEERLNVLMPGASDSAVDRVPTSDTEQSGMGAALGGVVGGTSGIAVGTVVASLLIPGVGPVAAVGLLAMALFGAGGAVAGATAGQAIEESLTDGLPKDELFVYEDALRKGRIVVIGLADDDKEGELMREIFTESGAESVDAARKEWWIGLRDAEEVHYTTQGKNFSEVEPVYRTGFEAAQYFDATGRSYDDAREELHHLYPDAFNQDPFRHGFERGGDYYRRIRDSHSDQTHKPDEG
jgi:hypothetical protein